MNNLKNKKNNTKKNSSFSYQFSIVNLFRIVLAGPEMLIIWIITFLGGNAWAKANPDQLKICQQQFSNDIDSNIQNVLKFILEEQKNTNKKLNFIIDAEKIPIKKFNKNTKKYINTNTFQYVNRIYLLVNNNETKHYIQLTPYQVRSIFGHFFYDIDKDPILFFNNLANINQKNQFNGKISNITTSVLKKLTSNSSIKINVKSNHENFQNNIYQSPIFMGYLIKKSNNTNYYSNKNDSKVYLNTNGYFVANTKKEGLLTCNPFKKCSEKPKKIIDCFVPQKLESKLNKNNKNNIDKNSYLFLDLNSAFSNDLSLFWGCTLVKEANIENQLKAVNPNISKKNINIIKNETNGNLQNIVEEVINGNITVIEDPLKNKNN
jgi:hypothetical protein